MPSPRRVTTPQTPEPAAAALREAIDRAALEAPTLPGYRLAVLTALSTCIRFDAALVHALSPRVPLETAGAVGFEPARLRASLARWDELAVEFGRLRDTANREGVASDTEVYPPGSRGRARFERVCREVFGARSVCIAHLVLRGRVRAVLVLMARRRDAFPTPSIASLRAALPSIALGDALHERLDAAPTAEVPLALVCRDGRLTLRQRSIVELVALGRTNADIGTALALSPHSIRNHLARTMRRIGAANRAELVRLVAWA